MSKRNRTLIHINSVRAGACDDMPVKAMVQEFSLQTPPGTGHASERASVFEDARIAREWQTVAAMIDIYCEQHGGGAHSLCAGCAELKEYARVRLERCRFAPAKPTCAKCPVHCYQKVRREQIRTVMRYSGPRMLWRHPILTLRHWLDGRAPFATTSSPE